MSWGGTKCACDHGRWVRTVHLRFRIEQRRKDRIPPDNLSRALQTAWHIRLRPVQHIARLQPFSIDNCRVSAATRAQHRHAAAQAVRHGNTILDSPEAIPSPPGPVEASVGYCITWENEIVNCLDWRVLPHARLAPKAGGRSRGSQGCLVRPQLARERLCAQQRNTGSHAVLSDVSSVVVRGTSLGATPLGLLGRLLTVGSARCCAPASQSRRWGAGQA